MGSPSRGDPRGIRCGGRSVRLSDDGPPTGRTGIRAAAPSAGTRCRLERRGWGRRRGRRRTPRGYPTASGTATGPGMGMGWAADGHRSSHAPDPSVSLYSPVSHLAIGPIQMPPEPQYRKIQHNRHLWDSAAPEIGCGSADLERAPAPGLGVGWPGGPGKGTAPGSGGHRGGPRGLSAGRNRRTAKRCDRDEPWAHGHQRGPCDRPSPRGAAPPRDPPSGIKYHNNCVRKNTLHRAVSKPDYSNREGRRKSSIFVGEEGKSVSRLLRRVLRPNRRCGLVNRFDRPTFLIAFQNS